VTGICGLFEGANPASTGKNDEKPQSQQKVEI
jgi:hypothetical protein